MNFFKKLELLVRERLRLQEKEGIIDVRVRRAQALE